MVLKENWSSGDQLTAAQLNELTAAVKARYTKPGAGIPTSDLNAGQLEAKVKEVGDANYVRGEVVDTTGDPVPGKLRVTKNAFGDIDNIELIEEN